MMLGRKKRVMCMTDEIEKVAHRLNEDLLLEKSAVDEKIEALYWTKKTIKGIMKLVNLSDQAKNAILNEFERIVLYVAGQYVPYVDDEGD